MTGPLVGRAEELAAFERALVEIDQGRAAVLAVVGEPGIGKTRLLTELAGRADARRHVVLSGSASELERDLPFWVFIEAIDEYVQGLEPTRLDALDPDLRTQLSHVLPSLSRFASATEVSLPHERYRIHRSVRDLLERLTAIRPLVVLLDDVHWADAASLEMLGALLRQPPDAAVLLAVAVRPRQAPGRLVAALERAQRAGLLTRIEVGVLTTGEARQLLGDGVHDTVAAQLYDESGGNPFYLEQLARSAVVEHGAPPVGPQLRGREVPHAVESALTEEIRLLSDRARLVLQGAAVAGDPFEPELAAAAAGMSEASALEALDKLLGLDIVRQTDVPRRFRFRHPLVRRAVYEATPAGWRLGAHERSAEALAARGATVAERAHHVQCSARRGDVDAVATLRAAGEAAAQRAPASAATWFSEALRLLAGDAPVEVRLELLLARARALAATGQFVDGHATLLESIDLVPAESSALRVRLTTACAGIEHLLGRHEQAHTRLTRAVDRISDPGSPEAAALMIELAMDGFFLMDYQRMLDWAERARAVTRGLDDRPLAAAALAVLTFACAARGATSEAEAHLPEAAALVDGLDDAELAVRLDAAANLAGAELYLDRYPDAASHAKRALTVARSTGQSEFVPLADSILGQIELLRGRLDDAGRLLDDAVEAARISGNVQALAGNLVNRSLTALAAGDLELALATAEEDVDLARGLDQSLVCAAGFALAAASLENGNAKRAVDVLLASSGGEELPLIPGVWRARSLELLTRGWLALGRPVDAGRAAACAHATAVSLRLRMGDAMADRAAAAVALDGGAPRVAARRALAAAEIAGKVGAPVEAGVARTLAGRALAEAGQPDRAVIELQRAAAELDACGALRYRAAAERDLRRLGHGVHRRTRPGRTDGSGVDALTERELQVALLVVDRRTNPEIAEALFLSPKTIETHLRNAFRKLNVSSRAELARLIERARPT